MTHDVMIRPLDPAEWETFRDFRLAALKAAPGVFATAYADAVARTSAMWQANIRGPAHQVFGLFEDNRLIGITAVFADTDDPSGATAALAMSFILPAYGGRGLSRQFYETRLGWVRDRPQFRRVIVSHRASNEASRRANQLFGFVETHRTPRAWPDGTCEDEVSYELTIDRAG